MGSKSQIDRNFPADFPLPVFEGARFIRVDYHERPEGLETRVLSEIKPQKESPPTIGRFYKKLLKVDGWKISMERSASFFAEKGNTLIKVFATNHHGLSTTITLISIEFREAEQKT